MIGYVLMVLGSVAVLSAFLFRSPIFIFINRHRAELWLLVLNCRSCNLFDWSLGRFSFY